jgi:hypothetical protein
LASAFGRISKSKANDVEHVFLLLVWLGTGDDRRLESADLFFRSLTECNYFASQITKRYGNYSYSDYIDARDRATAYCVPRNVEAGSVKVY